MNGVISLPTPYKFMSEKKREPVKSDHDISVALMYRIAEGDSRALQELIHKWKMPIINFIYRSIGNFEDAEEIALKTFTNLYKNAGNYEPTAKFSTYLFLIAKRLMISEIRKQKSRKLCILPPEELQSIHYQNYKEDLKNEIEEVFLKALQKIPEKYRMTLILIIQEEMSYPDAAEILEITEGNLRTQLHRGRKLLKLEMDNIL